MPMRYRAEGDPPFLRPLRQSATPRGNPQSLTMPFQHIANVAWRGNDRRPCLCFHATDKGDLLDHIVSGPCVDGLRN